jgi:carbamate kinase
VIVGENDPDRRRRRWLLVVLGVRLVRAGHAHNGIRSTWLDAESEGQIGYVVELALDNAIDHQDMVTVITRVLVDADDPAFGEPSKFIGPVYDEQRAQALASERGWVVKPDGDYWRRVVPSPDELHGLIDGTAGTQIRADGPGA